MGKPKVINTSPAEQEEKALNAEVPKSQGKKEKKSGKKSKEKAIDAEEPDNTPSSSKQKQKATPDEVQEADKDVTMGDVQNTQDFHTVRGEAPPPSEISGGDADSEESGDSGDTVTITKPKKPSEDSEVQGLTKKFDVLSSSGSASERQNESDKDRIKSWYNHTQAFHEKIVRDGVKSKQKKDTRAQGRKKDKEARQNFVPAFPLPALKPGKTFSELPPLPPAVFPPSSRSESPAPLGASGKRKRTTHRDDPHHTSKKRTEIPNDSNSHPGERKKAMAQHLDPTTHCYLRTADGKKGALGETEVIDMITSENAWAFDRKQLVAVTSYDRVGVLLEFRDAESASLASKTYIVGNNGAKYHLAPYKGGGCRIFKLSGSIKWPQADLKRSLAAVFPGEKFSVYDINYKGYSVSTKMLVMDKAPASRPREVPLTMMIEGKLTQDLQWVAYLEAAKNDICPACQANHDSLLRCSACVFAFRVGDDTPAPLPPL